MNYSGDAERKKSGIVLIQPHNDCWMQDESKSEISGGLLWFVKF